MDGLYLLLLGSVVFVLLGGVLEHNSIPHTVDFSVVYFPARTLLEDRDPYAASEVLSVYRAVGGDGGSSTEKTRQIVTRYLYLPNTFAISLPFAMLPWGIAQAIWMALTGGTLLLASLLIWDIAADYAPIVSGAMIGFFLANSEVVLILGNSAGFAVGLCVVAVWCFLRERFIVAGVVCLAVSLALKPQDAGLIWLYFLLAGGVRRKYALATLLVTAVLALPAVLWVWHIAPHWFEEWRANVTTLSSAGGVADPGPTSAGSHRLGLMVNLQAAFSFFRDDPHFYNAIAYFISAPLLFLWALGAWRSARSPQSGWLAMAAIAPLTLLPVYHHLYDAKLMLLTVPACAMLWAKGGWAGRLALLVNAVAFVLTGDLPWAVLLGLIERVRLGANAWMGQFLSAAQVIPAPAILLVTGSFYLWLYWRDSPGDFAKRQE
jgi:hypothetical protein